MERDRFDPDDLDPLDPFELDEANIPHLHKHGFTTDDLYDIWADPDAIYAPARPDGFADWAAGRRGPRRHGPGRAARAGSRPRQGPPDRHLPRGAAATGHVPGKQEVIKVDDTDAYDFYAEPANREPGPGPARRVRRQRPVKYDTHVPVRFTRDVIDQVKTFADEDGVTVSTWIRQAVRRELRRRTAEPDRLTTGTPAS